MADVILYDITKTETILFFKAQGRKPKNQRSTTRLTFRDHQAKFNNKATRQLEILFDSRLTFSTNIKKSIYKAQVVGPRFN